MIFYMPMLVRGGGNALALGATIAAVVLFGTVCSVDNSGLSGMSGGAGAGGKATGGSAGHPGGHGGGTAGAGTGGMLGSGGQIVIGTGGHGTGGTFGTGGMLGSGGRLGTGGLLGTGGTTTGGTSGAGGSAGNGSGGTAGTGGVAGAAGNGSGGAAGGGGMNATGGAAGSQATGGMGGHGGGRPPSCASFPSGTSLTTPTDGRLHCYWVHGSQIDWNSAETVCENDGGTLVTILSEAENTTVVQLASQANLFTGIGMTGQVFIGATDGRALDDRSGAGDYAWVTGEPWDYQIWHNGQPDGACTGCSGPGPNAGCACDHRGAIASDGTWYDRTQTTTRPFVCEAIAP